jgi:trehalose/maltose hydrolase-like predicted phosphorylase
MQSELFRLDPRLPASWSALRFPLVWDGQPLYVQVEPGRVTIEHRGQRPLPTCVCGQARTLEPGGAQQTPS